MNRIVELQATNVKRLKAVSIKPGRNMVLVGGLNGQGKSSLLDSILYALCGGKHIAEQPVRSGQDRMEVKVRLENGLIVRRTMTEGGKPILEIKQDIDGVESKVSSPQALLDKLVGSIAFDPLAFTRLKPADQIDLLKGIVGVDTAKIDKRIAARFEERKFQSRLLRDAEGAIISLPRHDDAPDKEVSATELVDSLSEIAKENARRAEVRKQATNAKQKVVEAEAGVQGANREVERLRKELAEAEENAAKWVAYRDKAKLTAETLESKAKEVAEDKPDAEIRTKLASIEELNRKARENAAYAAKRVEIEGLRDIVKEKGDELEAARADKVHAMALAKWPVPGLSFSDSGVTFNDLPFEQCSSAEQWTISTAIGISQNPKLRVMMIREGSLLDKKSMASIEKLAIENDCQIFIEVVTDNPSECTVLIEDGSVVSDNEASVGEETSE